MTKKLEKESTSINDYMTEIETVLDHTNTNNSNDVEKELAWMKVCFHQF